MFNATLTVRCPRDGREAEVVVLFDPGRPRGFELRACNVFPEGRSPECDAHCLDGLVPRAPDTELRDERDRARRRE